MATSHGDRPSGLENGYARARAYFRGGNGDHKSGYGRGARCRGDGDDGLANRCVRGRRHGDGAHEERIALDLVLVLGLDIADGGLGLMMSSTPSLSGRAGVSL